MSNSIKDLLDYNLVKICSKCGVVKVISNFYFREDSNRYRNVCISCKNEKQRIYEKDRLKTDVSFRIIRNTRCRIHHALNGNSKSKSSREILGIDIESYKKWIEYQMIGEMNWGNIHIDHVKPISSFDISKEDELLEAFNWKNTQPLLKEDNLRKSTKHIELDYQLQFTKVKW